LKTINADDIAPALRQARAGRFIIEEIPMAGAFLPSGHSCRRWGFAIRHPDGSDSLEPTPWPA
jgi:hypothetical protein